MTQLSIFGAPAARGVPAVASAPQRRAPGGRAAPAADTSGAALSALRAQARTSDPISSHAAADRVERDGVVKSHAQRILAVVHAAPGLTAKQIAFEAGLTHEQVARRLPKMEEIGLLHRPQRDPKTDDGSPLTVLPGPDPNRRTLRQEISE